MVKITNEDQMHRLYLWMLKQFRFSDQYFNIKSEITKGDFETLGVNAMFDGGKFEFISITHDNKLFFEMEVKYRGVSKLKAIYCCYVPLPSI